MRHDLGVVDQLIAQRQGLTVAREQRTLSNMYEHSSETRARRGASRARRAHPAQRRLYNAGTTITAVAAELHETRARVSTWMADGDAVRAIPRRHAIYLRDKYSVPLSAWRRIQD